jgi:hypothetical protein
MVTKAQRQSFKIKKPVVIRYASKEEVRRAEEVTFRKYDETLRKLARS